MSNALRDLGFPFTDVGGDRMYSSEDWRIYFDALVTGGVVGAITNELQVKPQTVANKSIFVDTGAIMIQGAMRKIESTQTLNIADNTSGNPRIDRIVARLNYTDRKIEFAVVQGTPAASPSAPAVVRTTSVYEYSLAKIAVANGFSTIVVGNITDERQDEAVCGYFKYRAKPAWYPDGEVPSDAWLYAYFQNQLTAQERSDVKNNPTLMAMINQSAAAKLATVGWELITEYATAGSFTWTAPDLNSGQAYEIGIFVMGGGASGAASRYQHTTNTIYGVACGGGAGRTKNKKRSVTPGTQLAVVVGAGGAAAVTTTSANNSVNGNPGGTSSMDGLSAIGGKGGGAGASTSISPYYGGDGSTGSSAMAGESVAPGGRASLEAPVHGTLSRLAEGTGGSVAPSGESRPSEAIDPFSNVPIGGAGGGVTFHTNGSNNVQTVPIQADGTQAGIGVYSGGVSNLAAAANNAKGSGGGGAVIVGAVVYSTTASGGKGSDGVVRIYKRLVIL